MLNLDLALTNLEIQGFFASRLKYFIISFDKYINTFYELKLKAERAGDKTLRSIAKLHLNSLYTLLIKRVFDKLEYLSNSNKIKIKSFTLEITHGY